MKPTLYVLAAGMGSRYGSLKQLDGLGPNGETIMDYSIYDAIRGGFGRVVFVIRRSFEKDFQEKIVSKYEKLLPVLIVYQDLENLPKGYTCPEGREKPWGTNHAVMMAQEVIKEPFAVINADDFYGKESFAILAKKLTELSGHTNEYCMVGYRVGNTLSESGTVARGVCEVNQNNYLTGVVERTAIARNAKGEICFTDENGVEQKLEENTPVSMNMWGFTPDYFEHSTELFSAFLDKHINEPKSEFFIPLVVNHLIKNNIASCQVLDTPSKWFGVTYAADRESVVEKLHELIAKGEYPEKLF